MKGDGPRPGNRYIGSFYEMTYQEFLQSKVELAPSSGFEVAAECEIDMPTLFDFMDGGKECQDE